MQLIDVHFTVTKGTSYGNLDTIGETSEQNNGKKDGIRQTSYNQSKFQCNLFCKKIKSRVYYSSIHRLIYIAFYKAYY